MLITPQNQCFIHNIPIEASICLEHVFDWDELAWDDVHVDLPVNPINSRPILLVPKAVVRRFSVINYKDFWNSTYRYTLRDIEIERSIKSIGREPKITWKEINQKYNFCKNTVVKVLHENPELRRQYLANVEARPVESILPADLEMIEGTDKERLPLESYLNELASIKPGNADCKKFEELITRLLTRLYSPPLSDPHPQVKTVDGREIIDITFYNSANFWFLARHKKCSILV